MTKNARGIFSFIGLFLVVILVGVYFARPQEEPVQDDVCVENQQKYAKELFYRTSSEKLCEEEGPDTEICYELMSRHEVAKKQADPYKDECMDIWSQSEIAEFYEDIEDLQEPDGNQ